MLKNKLFLLLICFGLLLTGCSNADNNVANSAQNNIDEKPATEMFQVNGKTLTYQVNDTNAPIVYYTKDVSAQGLMKVYKALNQEIIGKTAIKVSFGSSREEYINPNLMTELIKETNGTFVDSCGFTPPRNTAQGNRQMAIEHGFTAVGPVDILDEDGDLDMPIVGDSYHLKFARTGSHFKDYDTIISVNKFKAHYLPIYDGTMKNISLTLASLSGHALIHSAGENDRNYESRNQQITAESFADAAKAAMDYKKGRWAFINVIDDLEPTDSCSDTKNLGNIGIIASVDPVAIDQVACDLYYGAAPTDEIRTTWENTHSIEMLEYAEKIGVGQRHYQLISVD